MKASGKTFWNNVDKLWPASLRRLCDVTGLSYQRMRDQRSSGRLPTLSDAYAISTAVGATIEKLISGMNTSDFPENINAIAERTLHADDDDIRFIRTILGIDDSIYTLYGDFHL